MLKTLSIRTGLLSLLAVMTLLLLIVSGIGIYALTQSSSSLQRINHLQGEQMVQLNSGYTLILRARNEAGQAVRMMEIGLLDDAANAVMKQTLAMGCWSEQELVGEQGHWQAKKLNADASEWEVLLDGEKVGEVKWGLVGEHNMHNGLMAIAAARHVGVLPADAANALGSFINARRRLELRGEAHGVTVYDDFAHHPTAILATLAALRGKVGGTARILAVLEPRSNTMKMGICKDDLAPSLGRADEVFLLQPQHIPWQVAEVADACIQPAHWSADVDALADMVVKAAQPGDHILVMSNGGFGGIHQKLLDGLAKKAEAAADA